MPSPVCYHGGNHGLLVKWNNHGWAAGLSASGAPPASAATSAAPVSVRARLPLSYVWKARRAQLLLLVATAVVIPFLFTPIASAAEPKRVLLVHSFGSATPPFTVESTAFETELVEKMGERVDLDEVSLDMARYADNDMQEAIVDYLQKRQAKWKPDLVVPIGSPAGIFVAKYRDRLFPEAPILYATLDRRLLPSGALDKNAAYIGQIYEIPGFLEDMLQIAPATKNIAVVVGATPLEHLWEEVFKKAAEPLAGRIKFTYYSDLTFDQMKERVSTLPPNSYIFFLLLLRDAAGVTLNADEALEGLHAVAHAPINSIFNHQLGLGIVGGRLHQSESVGKEAAEIAIRILHGEPASSFPPRLVERLPPRYDWRELQRWKIDGKLLPPGSTVLFRESTVWERHRVSILGGISVILLQALLITGLIANLVKRHRAERSLTESEQRFQNAADIAPVMIWMSGADKLCNFFNKGWLEFTGRSLAEELGNGWVDGVHPEDVTHCLDFYGAAFEKREPFAMEYRLRRKDGEYRWVLDSGTPRFDAGGAFVGYIGSCTDIGERKQAELDHQTQSMELARVGRVALMGELAASLAHEVNNPLGAMVANAGAGQRMIAHGQLQAEELQELLADIISDGHRAREVIQGIRNMVRKSNASMTLVSISEILRDLLRIVRADAMAKKVILVVEVDPDAEIVMGDRVQLLQVLLNLTLNAFEALSAVRADLRRVVIRAGRTKDGQICVSVRDSGPGFPDGMVDQLFEPFFSTKVEGTGMGLAIARTIMEAHGGTLSGKNCDDMGAIFTVCLPEASGARSKAA